MPMWFPAAYMNAPVNICIHRIFCRDSMGPEMPWTVWQMDSTSSQASRGILQLGGPVRDPAQSSLDRSGGQAQQYRRRRDLRHIVPVCLGSTHPVDCQVVIQLCQIGVDGLGPLRVGHGLPAAQLQHRDIHSPADVEPDALRVGPAVGEDRKSVV